MAKEQKKNMAPEIVNRKARFEYEFIETFTAGLVLKGSEVKSVREGKANLSDAFCVFFGNEFTLVGAQITPYSHGAYANHEAKRHRLLLLNKKEMQRLKIALNDKGMTVVPYRMYFSERGIIKIDIELAKGKKLYDKRETIKERDVKRDLERE